MTSPTTDGPHLQENIVPDPAPVPPRPANTPVSDLFSHLPTEHPAPVTDAEPPRSPFALNGADNKDVA